MGQIGPAKVASKLAERISDEKERNKIKVLDIGAGTGRIGVHLQKLGFGKIHALGETLI